MELPTYRSSPFRNAVNPRTSIGRASRDAEVMRRAREASAEPSAANGIAAADALQAARIGVCVLVFGLCVITLVTSQWTRSKSSVTAASGAVLRTEIGFFNVCNCTSITASYNCAPRRHLAQAIEAFGILCALTLVGSIASFLVASFVTFRREAEYVLVGCLISSTLFSFIMWAMAAALRNNDCSGQLASYAEQGLKLNWGFALRVLETCLLFALCVVAALRATGRVAMWPVVFLGLLLVLVLDFSTLVSNEWMSAKGLNKAQPHAVAVVGPWSSCSCLSVTRHCPPLAAQFRAAEAFGIVRVIAQLLQVLCAAFIPAFVSLPGIVQMIVAWSVWVIHLLSWVLAVATSIDCRCGLSGTQQLSWPFAIDFVAFALQTALAGYATYIFARKRVLEWVSRLPAGGPLYFGVSPPTKHAKKGRPRSSSVEEASSSRKRQDHSPDAVKGENGAKLGEPYADEFYRSSSRSLSPHEIPMAPVAEMTHREQRSARIAKERELSTSPFRQHHEASLDGFDSLPRPINRHTSPRTHHRSHRDNAAEADK